MRPGYEEFLKSDLWKSTAHSVYCRAGGECERCGTAEGQFNAHHIVYIAGNRSDAPSSIPNGWLPDFAWLMCLCEDCHRHIHRLGFLSRFYETSRILQSRRPDCKRRLVVIEMPFSNFEAENWIMCRGQIV